MIQSILWGVTFVTLWITIVWLSYLTAEKPKRRWKTWPSVTFGIPAYNEQVSISKTIKSLVELDYPSSKKEIIVVDNNSSDNTAKVVRKLIKANPKVKIRLLTEMQQGKAFALSAALSAAKGQFFAVVDADSRVSKASLKKSLEAFTGKDVGAVISRVKVDNATNFLERLQRFEYIMSNMFRRIMCNFGTLSITPGVLSVYKTKVLRKVGGFTLDPKNMTEDFEIAMRLKHHGYAVEMEHDSVTYTNVPSTWDALWRQRVRWSRGYFYNHWKYRDMFFSKKHGIFGFFQMPMNMVGVFLLVLNIGIISIEVLNYWFDFVFRSLTIPNYFLNRLTDWPTLKEFVLAKNVQIVLPVLIVFVLGTYLVMAAHKKFGERLRQNVVSFAAYTIIMPYFATANWVSSIAKEVSNAKRKW